MSLLLIPHLLALLCAAYITAIVICTVLSYLMRIMGILINHWEPTEEELRRRERAYWEDFPWTGDETLGRKAYFVTLVAKLGKEEALQAFLKDVNRGVDDEPLTGPWFGFRFNKSTFFIFETFPHTDGREAHNVRPGGLNFMRADELKNMLVHPAQSYKMDVLHGKYGVIMGQPVTPVVK
ncbi:hypothetical protein BKA61DRAFT_734723 [Leptodontidium sp. MPI-SDFR-AT-0119]|nr:hypothetical protein BKA61DRAFT_734723 [Leptodontidium sp. MPI-SDFR-AT-0119]